jgi:hypothetical protein
MMGRDIYFQIGNDKGESKRKALVMDHQVNRRGQVQGNNAAWLENQVFAAGWFGAICHSLCS